MAAPVDWRDAREKLIYANLAYTSPPGSETTPCPEIDALAHVVAELGKHGGARLPTGARYFNSAQTGKRSTDAQFYTLDFDDAVVFAFRGTEVDSLTDIAADLDIDRVWFTEVAYGRCSATGNRGLDRLDDDCSVYDVSVQV